jgi:hypothetical protein
MKPMGSEKSSLKTTKKGNVTINPKKEDLMSENLRKRIQSSVEDLKEAAKKKAKEKQIAAAKAGKRWQDSDGDGKWYEPGQDVKKEECDPPAAKIDDSASKKASKDRMKQKMLQMTQDHDAKRAGGK